MMKKVKRTMACFLVLCMFFFIGNPFIHAHATESSGDENEIYIETIGNGKMFVQQTESKLVAIGADSGTHLITVSIKYNAAPSVVYQWIFEDYPVEEFNMDSLEFWLQIIEYAEERIAEAEMVNFTHIEITEDTRMARSSAGADLLADMRNLEGSEHSDLLVQTKVMDGKAYGLYETMSFYIREVDTYYWDDGVTIGSLVVGVLGLVLTNGTAVTVCGALGLGFTGVGMILPGGSINKYQCTANYYRYVKVGSGSTYYANAYKVVTYYGFEDADLNSSGRAAVSSDTRSCIHRPDEAYYNSGIFDAAYLEYNS